MSNRRTHQCCTSKVQQAPTSFLTGGSLKILQLNVEGLTTAKCEVLDRICQEHQPTVVLLQETHQTLPDRMKLQSYCLADFIPSPRHGLAIFIQVGVPFTCRGKQQIDGHEWISVNVGGSTDVINVYRSPNCRLIPSCLPNPTSPCLISGDFNCQHTDWGYDQTSTDGEALLNWADQHECQILFDAKQRKTFRSARWQTETNPDLAFWRGPVPAPQRRTLLDFPKSQHRPTLVDLTFNIGDPVDTRPVPRWNFKKADWDSFKNITEAAVSNLPNVFEQPIDKCYTAFTKTILHAAKHSVPRGHRNKYIPCWDDTCEALYRDFTAAPADTKTTAATTLQQHLDKARRERWLSTISTIDMRHSSRKAWAMIKRLTAEPKTISNCPVSANEIAAILKKNGCYANPDKEQTRTVQDELRQLKRSPTANIGLTQPFTVEELESALQATQTGKAAGGDNIYPEFIKNIGPQMTKWLLDLFNTCLTRNQIPKSWRQAKVIAILKPNKPPEDPKSYRPISLLPIPYKIMERLVLNRISPIIDPSLPKEQAGFRSGRCTEHQTTLLTSDIEEAFESKKKVGVVLVDLTAAYDTVWHKGLELKHRRILPDSLLADFIMNMISNRRFTLTNSNGETSRKKWLKNGVPQGSVLAPTLFNIFTADIPATNSKKYLYADDTALAFAHSSKETIEKVLTRDMAVMAEYYHKWRLTLSANKTVASMFHLDNHQATLQLKIDCNGATLPYDSTPTYLGVKLDRTLSYKGHTEKLGKKVASRVSALRKVAGTGWGCDFHTLKSTMAAMVLSPLDYCSSTWSRSTHTKKLDPVVNSAMRIVTGCIRNTNVKNLPILCGIPPQNLRYQHKTLRLANEAVLKEDHLLHNIVKQPLQRTRLKSRRTFYGAAHSLMKQSDGMAPAEWLTLAWNTEWQESQLPLVKYIPKPTSNPPGSKLDRDLMVILNRLRTGSGMFNKTRKQMGLSQTELCQCGQEAQTATHIIEHCPFFRPPEGISLHDVEQNPNLENWLHFLLLHGIGVQSS